MACASATANPFKLPRSKLPPEPYTNIDHSCPAEPVEECAVEPFEDPRRLPVAQAAPAGHAGAAAHLLRQARPRDAGAQHEDDALKRLAAVNGRTAAFRAWRLLGEQGRDQRPERVGDIAGRGTIRLIERY